MPELLQEDFTPMAVAQQLKEWLENEEARQEAKAALARTMTLLSGKGDAIGNIVRNLI
jgi:lipid A disaccharide synthetase